MEMYFVDPFLVSENYQNKKIKINVAANINKTKYRKMCMLRNIIICIK